MSNRFELLAEIDRLMPNGQCASEEDRARVDQLLRELEEAPADADQIRSVVKTAGLESSFGDGLITRGVTVRDLRTAVFSELQHRDGPATNNYAPLDSGGTSTAPTTIRHMAEALAARHGGPAPSAEAREYLHLRTVDMARACLDRHGVTTRLLSPAMIITRALGHTSGDFPALLQESGNRTLRQAYTAYVGGVRRIARESTAPDFRAKSRLMLGEAPQLLKVGEHGEVTHGTMAESKASYSLATYARIFGITRQALVNDDLGAFVDFAGRMGRAAAEFVAAQIAALLTSNPTMADGVALFHANHANLGTAAAISITSLGEALKLMRLQKGLDGVTPIDATPRYLVVPAEKEVLARQYVAQINATKSSDVNPFTADLEVVVDPRLDANSTTAWYVAADPALVDTLEYSYLEGEPGPQIETRAGFTIEGVETKVRLDFGCGVIDHRGLVKNAGA